MADFNIYDISMGEIRPATQNDIDQMQKGLLLHGLMIQILRRVTEPYGAGGFEGRLELLKRINGIL